MRIIQQVKFETPPLVLAAWPGMGNVGLIAMDYIRRQLNAQPFAELEMSPFFIPDSIVVKDGIAQFPEIPTSIFYYVNNPSLIIFESNAQVPGREGIAVIRSLLDLVTQFRANRIYTAAAFAQSMSYQATSEVMVTCNSPYLLEAVNGNGMVTPMPDGYIAGLNGLLLGVASGRSMEAACFLGTIPAYAVNIAYPKASLEIVRIFGKLIGANFELAELEQGVTEMDQQLATIEDRIKQFFPGNTEDDEISNLDENQVPHYIMEKIEQMFQKAEKDRGFAPELKKELDRWNLFELYENRFLDIFKEDKDRKAPPVQPQE
jgi:uncharacterized protein